MIIQTKKLKEALQLISPAAPKNAIVPILEHVIIEADGQEVRLKLSNLSETIETTFENSEENKKETITPHYQDLFKYVKLVNEVEISLTQVEGSVEIKAGQAQSRINGEDVTNFPQVPEIEGEKIDIPTEYLHIIKDRILPFASVDELKPHLTGAKMNVSNGKILLQATDAHQLVRFEANTDMKECDVLFRRAIPEVACMLFEGKTVSMYLDGSGCKLTDGKNTLTSRLLEERFPDTDNLMPVDQSEIMRADKKVFLSELQRAFLFVDKKEKMIKATFSPQYFKVSAKDINFDKSYENQIEVEGCKELLIGLDVEKIIKAAQKIQGDEIEIHHYSSATKMIKMVEDDYTIVTMPMMLTGKS